MDDIVYKETELTIRPTRVTEGHYIAMLKGTECPTVSGMGDTEAAAIRNLRKILYSEFEATIRKLKILDIELENIENNETTI